MIVNGKKFEIHEKLSVLKLLENLGLKEDRLVIEVNFEIIPREKFHEVLLNNEDRVEIVSFVGGG